ncbi:MAG: hypothetical protein JWM54_2435, partial [Acidobacteriaceae bacterium]|nr:hypothetical protein [Acidobacteriaceae bacterium]
MARYGSSQGAHDSGWVETATKANLAKILEIWQFVNARNVTGLTAEQQPTRWSALSSGV